MPETPSLVPHIPFLSQLHDHLNPSKLLPHDPTKLLPTNLLSEPSKNLLKSIVDQVFKAVLSKLRGFLTSFLSFSSLPRLLMVGGVLLLLVGMALAASVVGMMVLWTLSLVWVPATAAVMVVGAGFLSMCGSGAVVFVAVAWLARRFFRLADSSQLLGQGKDAA